MPSSTVELHAEIRRDAPALTPGHRAADVLPSASGMGACLADEVVHDFCRSPDQHVAGPGLWQVAVGQLQDTRRPEPALDDSLHRVLPSCRHAAS